MTSIVRNNYNYEILNLGRELTFQAMWWASMHNASDVGSICAHAVSLGSEQQTQLTIRLTHTVTDSFLSL